MKKILILLAVLAFGLLCFIAGIIYQWNSPSRRVETVEVPRPHIFHQDTLWALIQDYRLRNNLPTYIRDERICAYVDERLTELKTDYSHRGLERTSDARMEAMGFGGIGENIAGIQFGAPDNIEVATLQAWLDSKIHRAFLDSADYKQSCLRCDDYACIHMFAYY